MSHAMEVVWQVIRADGSTARTSSVELIEETATEGAYVKLGDGATILWGEIRCVTPVRIARRQTKEPLGFLPSEDTDGG